MAPKGRKVITVQQVDKKRDKKYNSKQSNKGQFSDVGSSMNIKGVIGSHASVTESEPDEESQLADPEIVFDHDNDDEESIDARFKSDQRVTVYFTLPSGQEEIILDYNMQFTDQQAYTEFKENGGGIGDFTSSMGRQNPSNSEYKGKIDMDFKLFKLINYIKKQGYPVQNSFVSFVSADFHQMKISCGPEPIAKSIFIS